MDEHHGILSLVSPGKIYCKLLKIGAPTLWSHKFVSFQENKLVFG